MDAVHPEACQLEDAKRYQVLTNACEWSHGYDESEWSLDVNVIIAPTPNRGITHMRISAESEPASQDF